jgi:hypothetical protein
MENSDLRAMWREAHISIQGKKYDKESIEKTIRMNHSNSIAKILTDIKLKIMGYSTGLIISSGLMIYAFLYLHLKLQVFSIIPLALAGLFFLIKTTIEINYLFVLNKTSDNESLKESLLLFRNSMNRTKKIDFLSYLLFFYLLAFLIGYNYFKDLGGERHLFSIGDFSPFLMVPIFLLLLIPWLVRYQHNREYKTIYSNLNKSVEFFNNETAE